MHEKVVCPDGSADTWWSLLIRPTWVIWLLGMEAALPKADEREALLDAVEDEMRTRGSADIPRLEVQIGQQTVLIHCDDTGDTILVWVWTDPPC